MKGSESDSVDSKDPLQTFSNARAFSLRVGSDDSNFLAPDLFLLHRPNRRDPSNGDNRQYLLAKCRSKGLDQVPITVRA